jgi:hypothetical protein
LGFSGDFSDPIAPDWRQRVRQQIADDAAERERNRVAAATALQDAYFLISKFGWAHSATRNTGHRLSIRHALRLTSASMVAQSEARRTLSDICGMHEFKWERLPLIDESDVLALLDRGIRLLGGVVPAPYRRRGGWSMSHGEAA